MTAEATSSDCSLDVIVIGGGQAGLAAGYYLRRAGLRFAILDASTHAGGAWRHGWDSLHLFSPAEYSSLPGWGMPPQEDETYPTATHVSAYLAEYEQRYELPVHRPVQVTEVHREGEIFRVVTDRGAWRASHIISATGTWGSPYLPELSGSARFAGDQLHTVDYRSPEPFQGKRVVIVGGGNSAAQIFAEVSEVTETTWVAQHPPRFMPDNVDGRVLFDVASRRQAAERAGISVSGVADLGDIVMVPPLRAARDRGVLRSRPMFTALTTNGITWTDGSELPCDVIIWCTGFRPDLAHLAPLNLSLKHGVPRTCGTRSLDESRLHLVGYGDWSGVDR